MRIDYYKHVLDAETMFLILKMIPFGTPEPEEISFTSITSGRERKFLRNFGTNLTKRSLAPFHQETHVLDRKIQNKIKKKTLSTLIVMKYLLY